MKLALIYSRQESHWISCQSITKNLYKAYLLAFKDATVRSFNYSSTQSTADIYFTAVSLKKFGPDKMIFIDHFPSPLKLVRTLKTLYANGPLPALYFHIFGDFPLMSLYWIELADIIAGNPALFLCASEKQRNFISQFICRPEEMVRTCPFPADAGTFYFNQELRSEWRSKLHLAEKDLAVVYTGRLSLQKNITLLIEWLAASPEASSGRLKLFLAGTFDDIASPFFGVHFKEGHYFHLCSEVIKKIPAPFRQNIHFLGGMNHGELNGVLNASDLFCGLGLYHDEDFGMSPLEALLTGMPAILSDWAGFSSFRKEGGNCLLVGTAFGKEGIDINVQEFHIHLQNVFSMLERETIPDRTTHGQLYARHFSLAAIADILTLIHARPVFPFEGLTVKMEFLNISMSRYHQTDNLADKFIFRNQKHSIYKDIYRSYVGPLEPVSLPAGP